MTAVTIYPFANKVCVVEIYAIKVNGMEKGRKTKLLVSG